MNFLVISVFAVLLTICQPTTLQLLEEQVEYVLMSHCAEYEKGSNVGVQLRDVNITYTGNSTIDAKGDSSLYYVLGSYTYDKYTVVNNQIFGEYNGRSFNKSGSTTYLAKVKSVLDEFRVQEIIIIDNPAKFDFANFEYEDLRARSNMLFPEVLHRSRDEKKGGGSNDDVKDDKNEKD